ncbi:biopolymer transporter ExbD [Phragmitibacter flavus]|nr:biopolymer transporter ExbD [Phragmitibacter flavus]
MKLVSHLPKQSFWLYLGPGLNVLLVLLIFLLLSSSFVVQSGIGVALPHSGSRLSSFERARIITVTTSASQTFYLDGEPVDIFTLRSGLQAKEDGSRRAILHIDKMAPFDWVQKAMNVALELGYEVGYATDPTPQ